MHAKNRYRGRHDLASLATTSPELKQYFITTPGGHTSLDFSHPEAVRHLNRALLLRDYGLDHWDIPSGSLCPGVPGRLDYVHVLADLLGERKAAITGLDVGTGASLIYPILGSREYGWNFIATDVDDKSLKVARALIGFNRGLDRKIQIRKQTDPKHVFRGVIHPGDRFAFSMCNPPFFADAAAAASANNRKWKQLGKPDDHAHNFGGRPNELWTPGGEPAFLRRMIEESAVYAEQVGWFTTLVSQRGYLRAAQQQLRQLGVSEHKEISIGQGGKKRRVLAWKYAS